MARIFDWEEREREELISECMVADAEAQAMVDLITDVEDFNVGERILAWAARGTLKWMLKYNRAAMTALGY